MDPSVVQALVQQAAAAEARLAQIESKIKGMQLAGRLTAQAVLIALRSQWHACICAQHHVDP